MPHRLALDIGLASDKMSATDPTVVPRVTPLGIPMDANRFETLFRSLSETRGRRLDERESGYCFDTLTRSLSGTPSRRGALRLLAGSALGGLLTLVLSTDTLGALTLCHFGSTIVIKGTKKEKKKQKKKHLGHGDTLGPCPPATSPTDPAPNPPPTNCTGAAGEVTCFAPNNKKPCCHPPATECCAPGALGGCCQTGFPVCCSHDIPPGSGIACCLDNEKCCALGDKQMCCLVQEVCCPAGSANACAATLADC